MSSNERVLYPMLGVGAFFALFWVGFVVAYELGWACDAMLVNGLLLGCLGTYCIVRLERLDTRRTAAEPARPKNMRGGGVEEDTGQPKTLSVRQVC